MSLKPPLVIEKFTVVAPLGLRFHDTATGTVVSEGLNVSIYRETSRREKKRVQALPNRVGVYVVHRAEGLEDFSRGAGDAEFWQNNPPQKSYIIEVLDEERRFQPFKFSANLPVRGVYQWESPSISSPGKTFPSIPLYSAPTRAVTGGTAVVRADLRETEDRAASWAVLEAYFEGELVARGIADKDGKIALIFPALAPQSEPLASPPSSGNKIPLGEQAWQLGLTIKYQPSRFFASPPGETAGEESADEALPDLRLVLAQSDGTLWADTGRTEELSTVNLKFGEELVLRSRAQSASPPVPSAASDSSVLFVSPAV